MNIRILNGFLFLLFLSCIDRIVLLFAINKNVHLTKRPSVVRNTTQQHIGYACFGSPGIIVSKIPFTGLKCAQLTLMERI